MLKKHGLNGFREAIGAVYQAINEDEGMAALLRFTEKWGKQHPSCVKSWNDNWDMVLNQLDIMFADRTPS